MLRDHALDKSFPDHMDMLHAVHAAKAYAGMTLNEFADFVTRELVREADGFENMTYAETFYQPMIEVVEYLQANGFKCYIVSGSDRFICRTFVEGVLDIPYENIIGMDVQLEATNQGDEDGVRYVYNSNDTLIRTDNLVIKNLKDNYVLSDLETEADGTVSTFLYLSYELEDFSGANVVYYKKDNPQHEGKFLDDYIKVKADTLREGDGKWFHGELGIDFNLNLRDSGKK